MFRVDWGARVLVAFDGFSVSLEGLNFGLFFYEVACFLNWLKFDRKSRVFWH